MKTLTLDLVCPHCRTTNPLPVRDAERAGTTAGGLNAGQSHAQKIVIRCTNRKCGREFPVTVKAQFP